MGLQGRCAWRSRSRPSRVSSSTVLSRACTCAPGRWCAEPLSTVDARPRRLPGFFVGGGGGVAPLIKQRGGVGRLLVTAMPMSVEHRDDGPRISFSTSFGQVVVDLRCVRKPRVLPILMSVFLPPLGDLFLGPSRPGQRASNSWRVHQRAAVRLDLHASTAGLDLDLFPGRRRPVARPRPPDPPGRRCRPDSRQPWPRLAFGVGAVGAGAAAFATGLGDRPRLKPSPPPGGWRLGSGFLAVMPAALGAGSGAALVPWAAALGPSALLCRRTRRAGMAAGFWRSSWRSGMAGGVQDVRHVLAGGVARRGGPLSRMAGPGKVLLSSCRWSAEDYTLVAWPASGGAAVPRATNLSRRSVPSAPVARLCSSA